MRALVAAEERRKEKNDEPANDMITAEELDAAERERLIDPAHMDLFLIWYQFGGTERGLSPLEIAAMPAAMIADWQTLIAMLANARRKAKAKKGKRR